MRWWPGRTNINSEWMFVRPSALEGDIASTNLNPEMMMPDHPTEPAYRAVLALLTPDDREAVEAHVAACLAPKPGQAARAPERSGMFLRLAAMPKDDRWRALMNAIHNGIVPPDLPQCIALTDDRHWWSPMNASEIIVHDAVKTGATYPLAPPVPVGISRDDLVQYILDVGVPSNVDALWGPRIDIFKIIAKRSATLNGNAPPVRYSLPLAPRVALLVACLVAGYLLSGLL